MVRSARTQNIRNHILPCRDASSGRDLRARLARGGWLHHLLEERSRCGPKEEEERYSSPTSNPAMAAYLRLLLETPAESAKHAQQKQVQAQRTAVEKRKASDARAAARKAQEATAASSKSSSQ